MPNITIDNDTFQEILTEVGFPIITFDDFPYTEDQVKNTFIWKALREYYKWFPIKVVDEIVVGEFFDVDFPDEETYGVVDCRLITNTISPGRPTGEPFVDSAQILSMNTPYYNRYGTGNHYNQHISFHNKRAEYEAIKNSFNAFRFSVDKINRKVTGYTNLSTNRLNIFWAKYSTNYAAIDFDKIEEVNKLAASEILRGLGNLYSLQSTDLENEMNADYMTDRSDQLRDEVLQSWRAKTKPSLMRS